MAPSVTFEVEYSYVPQRNHLALLGFRQPETVKNLTRNLKLTVLLKHSQTDK